MKYIISATVGEEDQMDFECDFLPFLPNVGEQMILVTKDGPQPGIVKERRFHYTADRIGNNHTCGVTLICKPING